MEEKYTIPAQPQYSESIRRLQDSDPASASQTFNPLFARLIENIASVKRQADQTAAATVNGKPLSGGVSLTAGDVGAVPVSRKINGKALSGDISLSAADVGAAAAGHSHTFFTAGPTPPGDGGMLWIDTTPGTGGLKYFNGAAWVHVPVSYT